MDIHQRLSAAWRTQNSLLCVGIDPDLDRLPASVRSSSEPFLAFAREIITATAPHCAAFKPQFAHFAGQGRVPELRAICAFIREAFPDHILILDAKRGDIGSTADFYAKEAFEWFGADIVTVNPYMGGDTLKPFTKNPSRGIFVLCKTSNSGSAELQNLEVGDRRLFEIVAERASNQWNARRNVGLVVGATYPAELASVRAVAPTLPLLIPGIGAQGGDLEATLAAALTPDGTGVLINASRSIIYAAPGPDFAEHAAEAARQLNDQINALRP